MLTTNQFYTAISPIGASLGTAEGFFQSYMALFVVALFWIIGYLWKRQAWLRTPQIDVDTGRRELDWDYINAQRAEMATWPMWKKWMHKIF